MGINDYFGRKGNGVMKEYLNNVLSRLHSNYQETQIVWLWTNTGVWTLASFWTYQFWEGGGTDELWPLDGSDFYADFSIEEWLLFAVVPWVVVYYLNKSKQS